MPLLQIIRLNISHTFANAIISHAMYLEVQQRNLAASFWNLPAFCFHPSATTKTFKHIYFS